MGPPVRICIRYDTLVVFVDHKHHEIHGTHQKGNADGARGRERKRANLLDNASGLKLAGEWKVRPGTPVADVQVDLVAKGRLQVSSIF